MTAPPDPASPADRFDAVHGLFDAVQSIPADERPNRLAELTDDDSLRAEVLSLFDHDQTAAIAGVERIIQRTLTQGAEHAPSIPGVETHEVLGSGAMGLVYRGSQTNPKRDVAIKVIRAGLGTPALLRRFRAESDALARLRHPGIATVHQTGIERTPAGERPYLVMELVDGLPLDKWLQSNNPTQTQRLELIARTCDAVQHAHTRGVIHRDLKPSNILVTPDGSPKLIDFGVARITDPSNTVSMHTAAGEVVGTLAYMSPEQLLGDPAAIDTRSDVYTLGVIMFYTLSGTLPHDVTTLSIGAAARVIEEQAPKRPSAVAPALRGDPETIILHALEKEKDRRYQTAEALADDVRRYLNNLPISARPPSALYLLNRFAKRNKALVAAACVAATALVAASGVSTRSAITARDALAESKRSEQAAQHALAESELAAQRVRNINDFLVVDMIQAAHAQALGRDATIVDAVQAAEPQIAERFADDPVGEAEVRRTVALIYDFIGDLDAALANLDLALDALDKSGNHESTATIETLIRRADARTNFGDPVLAEADSRESLRIADAIGLPDESRLRDRILGQLASSLQSQGSDPDKLAEAEQAVSTLIERIESRGEPYPREILPYYSYLYQARLQMGQRHELEPLVARIIELSDYFGDPAARMTATSFEAWVHEINGRVEQALEARLKGLEIVRSSYDRGSVQYRDTLINVAGVHAMNNKFDRAIELFEEGVDVTHDVLGPYHWENERNAGYFAQILTNAGRPEEARRSRQRKSTLRFFNAGPDELESLERAYSECEKYFDSKDIYIEHLIAQITNIDTRAHAEFHIKFLANLGRLLARLDDPRGEQLMRQAIALCDPAIPEHKAGENIERTRQDMTDYLTRVGRPQDATAWNAQLDQLASAIPTRGE